MRFVAVTSSNLIGRRTIKIPEIISGVHPFMVFTVKYFFIRQPKFQNKKRGPYIPVLAGGHQLYLIHNSLTCQLPEKISFEPFSSLFAGAEKIGRM